MHQLAQVAVTATCASSRCLSLERTTHVPPPSLSLTLQFRHAPTALAQRRVRGERERLSLTPAWGSHCRHIWPCRSVPTLAVALTRVARPTHATARNKQPKTVKTCRIIDVECIGKLLERHTQEFLSWPFKRYTQKVHQQAGKRHTLIGSSHVHTATCKNIIVWLCVSA